VCNGPTHWSFPLLLKLRMKMIGSIVVCSVSWTGAVCSYVDSETREFLILAMY